MDDDDDVNAQEGSVSAQVFNSTEIREADPTGNASRNDDGQVRVDKAGKDIAAAGRGG